MNQRDYERGNRMAWRAMLSTCLQHLGIDDPASGRARWVIEREEAIAQLRDLCATHGDNDWPDNLNLSDIIDKHLARHLPLKG